MEEPDQYIDFMAKYKDWVSIKRLGIRETTKPHEIAYYLAGVRSTADSKAFKFIGIKTEVLDTYANSALKQSRKSAASLTEAANKFNDSAAKSAVDQACENKDLKPIAETYLLQKLLKNAGYEVGMSQEALAKIFSDLKPPPKPKGRLPGKKKEPEE